MFEKLRVVNFRSILDSGDINFSNLNIIVGPNNSGKSSILYTLLMLKQTLKDKDPKSTLVTSGPHIDIGGYLDFIHGHDPEGKLGIEFELKEEAFPELKGIRFTKGGIKPFTKYKLTFCFNADTNSIEIKTFDIADKQSKKRYRGTLENKKWLLAGITPELEPHIRPRIDHFLPFFTPTGKGPTDKKIASEGFDLFMASRLQIGVLEHLFDDILYVGPIRERIPHYGILGSMPYTELGPSGQNLMRVLSDAGKWGRSKRTIIQELNYWLDKKFKILKNVRIKNIDTGGTVKAILADDPRGHKDINLASMGSGLSQIVPVIVQTVLTPKKGCLIVEQPEIHLHPASQANLGDLFVQYAKEGRQLIIETHSEHLLLRIRRRIAEKKISPKLVKVFFVEKRGTQTRLNTLDLEENGHFAHWPKGFFEEGYQEAMAIADAQLRMKRTLQ